MRRSAPFGIVRPVSLLTGALPLLVMLACAQLCASQIAQIVPDASPNTSQDASFDAHGRLTVAGRPVPYLIRRLPVSSFPNLPSDIQVELTRRGCLIPQTYEAHQPESVVHGSFERPGSSDWAVLCSTHGTVSLLVFFGARRDQHPDHGPFILASAPETERLQPHPPASALGFNWAIDVASPEQVHDVQAGLEPRPPAIDHDALVDSTVDHRTVYHFYANGAWMLLDAPGQ
jgi:hypothetical protein